jgi:thioredoxin reductase (NADPH)
MKTSEPGTTRGHMVVVEGDIGARDRITEQLRRRYGADYDVLAEGSGEAGLAALQSLRDRNVQVAVVLSGAGGAPDGDEDALPAFFENVRALYPDAKRGLLVDWGAWADPPTAQLILRLMALGRIDYYVLRPWRSPDEYFHRTITEFLLEWERATSVVERELTVVGEAWSQRSHELRSLLVRNGVLHLFHASDSPTGRRILAEAGLSDSDLPVVLVHDGRVLVDPTNAQLADAYGVSTHLDGDADFDLIVVGAGPAGLAAAVYASSEGLRTLVVERESIGGQAGSSSLIRNYFGFARGISGADLAQRAYQQAWVFGTNFLLMREVAGLRSEPPWHVVTTAHGEEARARAVVVEARALAGADVFVVGGGNSAGQAAMHLARYARAVTLLVRGPSVAESMSQYLSDEIAAAGIRVRLQTEVVDGGGDGRLQQITLRDRKSGETWTEQADALFLLIGAEPHTNWLPPEIQRDRWGYVITGPDVTADPVSGRWQRPRPPLMLETCVPGIFAVGDVRRGSVKRVGSAVGEGSIVISQVHELLGSEPSSNVRPTRAAATDAGR